MFSINIEIFSINRFTFYPAKIETANTANPIGLLSADDFILCLILHESIHD